MKLSIIEHKDFGTVRVEIVKGEPVFCASDVCLALRLPSPEASLRKLDDDEKLMRKIFASGQNRDMWFVTESGLYTLIICSNKPDARKFRKWVTSEVLPSLRKYGRYVVPGSIEEDREESKFEKREKSEMLREIADNLTSTDRRLIAKRLLMDEWDVGRVLRGEREDVTVLIECIERSTRNANTSRKLRNSEVRRQVIAMLRGIDVAPLILNDFVCN